MRAAAVAAALLATACVADRQTTLVHPGQAIELDGRLGLSPGVATRFTGSVGTIEGIELDALLLWGGVADGSPLHPLVRGWSRAPRPPFRSTMSDGELMELVETSLAAFMSVPVTASDPRPATLGGQPGIRFRYAFTSGRHLDYDGVAVAATRSGRLYVIAYHGTRIYHFAKHLAAAEYIFDTVRLPDDHGER